MITWFRDLLAGPFKWVFLGLVVVAFAAFGDFDLSRFAAQDGLRVGDRAYTGAEIDREFTRRFSVQQREDPSLTKTAAAQGGLLEQTLADLRVRALVEQEASRLGLTATDEMVQRYLRESGAFDDANGEFSPRLVQLGLQNNGITPSQFREDLRSDIVRTQLVTALGVPSRAPEDLVALLLLRAGENRSLRTAIVTAEDAPPPTDDQLRSFYAANAGDYTAPELRTYRALLIDEQAVADRVAVPDEEVRQAFEAARARLNEPERRTFRQALFADEAQAQAAADRVAGGEPLRVVAADLGATSTRSEDAAQRDILDEAVAAAVFAPEAPGVVGPVRGTFGTVVAEVEAITPGTDVAFEDVAEELRAERRAELVRSELFAAIEEVESAFDEGASLAEAAQAAGLPGPRTYGPVDANLFTPDGAVETAPGAVHRMAFTLAEGEESDAIPLDGGGYAFVILDEVRPAAARPFEAVADRVASDYAASEREAALTAATDAFRARVAAGEAFETVAAEIGSDVAEVTVSAQRPDPDVPTTRMRAIFDAPIGGVVAEAAPEGGQAIVAIVDDVTFEGQPGADALLGGYRDQVGGQVTGELLEAYIAALEAEYGVERDDAVIAQALGLAE